ncbi:MAG: aspartate/glutamate racemase family protein [Anaerovoracaceae bacterium]|jgi:aspartate racemase|nr:aspartate/glutamate racemase family protein [Anaerovoracaceae bacterium]
MKTMGLIGGMSWESTVSYYQIVNQVIKKELGGLHSAKLLLYSVDFQEIADFQEKGEWEKSGDLLAKAALKLENAGADFIVICTNTMHKVAPEVVARIKVPLIHIAEATAEALIEKGIKKVALLGTKYTMKEDFYKNKIEDAGIKVLVPEEEDINIVNTTIYEELCLGIISEKSKREFLRIIAKLKEDGAQGVILGCTEIGLLIKAEDTDLPVFDTTYIHALKAALYSIQ